MKFKKKLLLIVSIFVLALGFTMTARAADTRFTKNVVVLTEGKSKTLTLKDSTTLPQVQYYEPEYAHFNYQVLGTSQIKVKATKAGIDTIMVKSGDLNISCKLVIMPKKNSAIKTKTTRKGTSVSYKKVNLTLPKVWAKYGYVMLTRDNSISFNSKSSYKTGYYGNVFTINWCSSKQWKSIKEEMPNCTYLKKKGRTVYYLTRPSDVQFNTESKKCITQYAALANTVNTIKKSFKVK